MLEYTVPRQPEIGINYQTRDHQEALNALKEKVNPRVVNFCGSSFLVLDYDDQRVPILVPKRTVSISIKMNISNFASICFHDSIPQQNTKPIGSFQPNQVRIPDELVLNRKLPATNFEPQTSPPSLEKQRAILEELEASYMSCVNSLDQSSVDVRAVLDALRSGLTPQWEDGSPLSLGLAQGLLKLSLQKFKDDIVLSFDSAGDLSFETYFSPPPEHQLTSLSFSIDTIDNTAKTLGHTERLLRETLNKATTGGISLYDKRTIINWKSTGANREDLAGALCLSNDLNQADVFLIHQSGSKFISDPFCNSDVGYLSLYSLNTKPF